MSEDGPTTEETLTRLGELARQVLRAQAAAAKQSIELGRAAWANELDPATASRAWLEAVGREGARYWRDAGVLSLDVAGQLVTLGSRGMARVLSDTQAAVRQARATGRTGSTGATGTTSGGGRGGGRAGTAPADEASGARGAPAAEAAEHDVPTVSSSTGDAVIHVPVTLHGTPGGTATGTVILANQHPRARRVALSPSPLRSAPGREPGLTMQLDPAGATIPAMGEQRVEVTVDLDADLVRPGERYTGTVEVTGGVEAVVDVVVEVG